MRDRFLISSDWIQLGSAAQFPPLTDLPNALPKYVLILKKNLSKIFHINAQINFLNNFMRLHLYVVNYTNSCLNSLFFSNTFSFEQIWALLKVSL